MEQYDDKKKSLLEMRNEAESQFDKLVVYLSAGALVFSVGFVKDIVGTNTIIDKWTLIVSWICFGISLLVNLVSFLSARKAADCKIMDEEKSSTRYNNITKCLNLTSFFGLIIGIIFLIYFAILNF